MWLWLWLYTNRVLVNICVWCVDKCFSHGNRTHKTCLECIENRINSITYDWPGRSFKWIKKKKKIETHTFTHKHFKLTDPMPSYKVSCIICLPTKALEIPFGLIFTVYGCVCVCVFAIDDYDAVTFIQKFNRVKMLFYFETTYFFLLLTKNDQESMQIAYKNMQCIHIQIAQASAKIICSKFFLLLLLLISICLAYSARLRCIFP